MAQRMVLEIGSFRVEVRPNGAGGYDLDMLGNGTGRFLEMNDGGGHLELRKPGSLSANIGLELDEAGRAIFHDA